VKGSVSRRRALKTFAGGAGAAAIMAATPSPVAAAQAATRRGLPRLTITGIKTILTQVGANYMTNVKVSTSEPGLYGVGCGGHSERQLIVATTVEQFLKPAVVGRYVDDIEDIWQMAWQAPYWRASVDASNAMSAIDGALWDIMGKRAGMPVYNLLGGKLRPALPMFAGVNGRDFKELEDNARKAMETGYKHLRVGAVGGDGSGDAAGQGATSGAGGRGPGLGGVGSPRFGERGPIYPQRGPGYVYSNNLINSFEHLRQTIGFDVNLCCEVDFRLYSNDLPGLGIDIDEKIAAKYVPSTPGTDRGVRCFDGSPCRP
jgi:mannonate dehydratase